MTSQRPRNLHSRVLCIDDEGSRTRAIANALADRGVEVIEATSLEEGRSAIVADASIECLLLDWTLGANDQQSHAEATELLRMARRRSTKLPIFLLADRSFAGTITAEIAGLINEFVWLLQDSPAFIASRVCVAADRYFDSLLPPFTRALINYNRDAEYSWAAPGHQGGVALAKSPVGRLFYDAY